MGSNRRSAEKRRKILEAGSILFSKQGFKATTLEDIARRAKMGKATLYYYFPDGKETIFAAVVQYEVEAVFGQIMGAMATAASVTERLRAYVRARVGYFHQKIAFHGLKPDIAEEIMPRAEAELKRYLDQETEVLQALVQAGIDSGEFRTLDPGVVGRIIQASFRAITSERPMRGTAQEITAETELFLTLLLGGLLRHPGEVGSSLPPVAPKEVQPLNTGSTQ
ncbi:MAG: TetR/AcrR family transcriptional regulator [Myxococcales bacterium]|nr:TetR/AcrR family transcriptional regulator [Myxococcales bacterium]